MQILNQIKRFKGGSGRDEPSPWPRNHSRSKAPPSLTARIRPNRRCHAHEADHHHRSSARDRCCSPRLGQDQAYGQRAPASPAATDTATRQPDRPPHQQARNQRPKPAAYEPSSKALKAIVDLQTAVKQERPANIPAKVAAAQAVARPRKTIIHRPATAEGALAAKDDAAIAGAIDAVAALACSTGAMAELYVRLGSTFITRSNLHRRRPRFRRRSTAGPRMRRRWSTGRSASCARAESTSGGRVPAGRSDASRRRPEARRGLFKRAVAVPTISVARRRWTSPNMGRGLSDADQLERRDRHLSEPQSSRRRSFARPATTDACHRLDPNMAAEYGSICAEQRPSR